MTLDDIVQDIHVLEQDLQTYERKYAYCQRHFMNPTEKAKNRRMTPG